MKTNKFWSSILPLNLIGLFKFRSLLASNQAFYSNKINSNKSYSTTSTSTRKNSLMEMGIIKEIKYGWNMTKDPEWIIKLNSKRYFKVFRLIGASCVFLVMSGISQNFHMLIKYYIFTIILIFSLLRTYIAIYYIWQFIKNVYNGKFIVRNSPINLVKTMVRVATNGLRSVGGFTVGTGFTYALCYEMDDILVKEGKSPYFVPGLREGIKRVGVEEELKKVMKWVGITDIVNVADKPRSGIQILDSLKPEERVELEKLTNKSWEEIYNNAKSLEDVNRNKVEKSIKNNVVKDLSEAVEKDDVFNDLKNNGKGNDKHK
jgi:hypothetical protein